MRHRSATLILMAGLALTTASCDPASTVAVPVLVITATWEVEGQEGRSFRFDAEQDDSEGLELGSFEGSETVEHPFAFYDLTGSWADGHLQFTVERPGGNVQYTGTFYEDRPTRLTMQSHGETIVLTQP